MPTGPIPWRSLLFVPVTSERFVANAHRRGADAIILDLEDSIAPVDKARARDALPDAIPRVAAGGAAVVVRINQPLALAAADIAAAVRPGVAALMLPKALDAGHVRLVCEAIAAREAEVGTPLGTTRLIPLVETASALPRLHAIAAADPRVAALGLGGEDLATDLDSSPTADGLLVWAAACVAAARAAGVTPLGSLGSIAEVSDTELYRDGLRRARALGFTAAACVHPAQVAMINEEYGASEAEVARARALLVAYETGIATGLGAVAFEGRMVDAPVAARARRLLDRAASWRG